METFLIFGFSLSGQSALNLILKKCKFKEIYIYDNSKNKQEEALNLTKNAKNVYILTDLSYEVAKNITTVILSPGVSIYNNWIKFFKKIKIKVVSELEFGFNFLNKKLIAITGTNGKTTCVKMLTNILNCANKKSIAVGNVGYPITKAVLEQKRFKYFVCEVSSFQLEAIKNFKPNIACILNITEDHLNRHKTFLTYKKTKFKIVKNLTRKNYFVCNSNIKYKNSKFNVYNFGMQNKKLGCFCKQGSVYFKNRNREEKICNLNISNLLGQHNIENALAVITICKILKIKNKHIINGLKSFFPDAHRLQKIFENNGVVYIDDSKATNVDATLRAIECFNLSNLILLLGGSNKKSNFTPIFQKIKNNIKSILCFGQVREELNRCAQNNKVNVQSFKTLEDATNFACNIATPKDVVLLSPANASFDEFSGYAERGEKFLTYIKNFYN